MGNRILNFDLRILYYRAGGIDHRAAYRAGVCARCLSQASRRTSEYKCNAGKDLPYPDVTSKEGAAAPMLRDHPPIGGRNTSNAFQ